MAGLIRFMQGLHNSSNAMVDRDRNTSISSQEMQGYSETDVAEEAEEDHYGADEDEDDISFKESDVDRVDCVSGNHFQNEVAFESRNDRRSPETHPQIQEDGVVPSEQGVVQSVGKMVRDFEKAVSTGNMEKSSAILSLLVRHRAKLKVQLLSIGSNGNNHPFTINVNVETYKVATGPKWKMQVTPSLTIFALKIKTSLLYGLPLSNQRWIMGRHIPADTETLRDNGICDNAEVFLYLTAPQGGDSKEEMALVNGFHKQLMLQGTGNEELSFTPAEFNKYLKEAKLRQDSSRMNQRENDFHPNQPTRTQPPGQAPLPWQTTQRSHAQPLLESTRTREVFQASADTNGLPQAFMGGDFDRDQMIAGATSEIPKNTPGTDGSFPPPHLVQRGPPISVIRKERALFPENQSRLNVKKKKEKKTAELHEIRAKREKKRVSHPERCQSVGQLAENSRLPGKYTAPRSRDFNYIKHGSDGIDRCQSLDVGDAFSRVMHDGNRQHRLLARQPGQIIRPADFRQPTPVRRTEDNNNPYNLGGRKVDAPLADANQFLPLNPFDGQQAHRPLARASRRLHRGSPVLACNYDERQYVPRRRHSLPSALDVGWACPSCTVVNPPQIPGCRVCLRDRPTEYEIPDYGSYIMDTDEARHVEELERSEQKLVELQENEEQKQKTMAKQNRIQLYQAAEYNLTTNEKPFECPICFSEIEPGQGVRLQECLHEICRDCCANHINISNEAEVQCPYTDGENDCQQAITDREIRQIVGQAKYDDYKKRSLKSAEAKAANTFHCLTPNCEGFCFYNEEHNFFECPICLRMSCLTCKVIHEGQNCREYQDDIKTKALNDETARQTQEQLQRLLQQGMAMNCPQCGVVIQKKGGCPNMTCSVCHRGFRWTGRDM